MTNNDSFLSPIKRYITGLFSPPPESPGSKRRSSLPPADQLIYDKVVKDLLAVCKETRSENSKLDKPAPKPFFKVVFRQSKSWTTIDKMLEKVQTTVKNSLWKSHLGENIAKILFYGKKINNKEGNIDENLSHIFNTCVKIKKMMVKYPDEDCKKIAMFFIQNSHSLFLVSHWHEVSPTEEKIYTRVFVNHDPDIQLQDSIEATFDIKEKKNETADDAHDKNIKYTRTTEIELTDNKPFKRKNSYNFDEGAQFEHSGDPKNSMAYVERFTRMYNIMHKALEEINERLEKAPPISKEFKVKRYSTPDVVEEETTTKP